MNTFCDNFSSLIVYDLEGDALAHQRNICSFGRRKIFALSNRRGKKAEENSAVTAVLLRR